MDFSAGPTHVDRGFTRLQGRRSSITAELTVASVSMCGKGATQDRARDGDEGVAAPGPVDPIEEEILLIQLLKDVPQRLQFRAEPTPVTGFQPFHSLAIMIEGLSGAIGRRAHKWRAGPHR